MAYHHLKGWRGRVKESMVVCLGGKCNKCGYSKYRGSLDFHHIDESTKEFTISNLLRDPKNFKTIMAECKKCILLCRNCHGEFHGGLWTLGEIQVVEFDETKLPSKEPTGHPIQCKICGTVFIGNGRRRTCSIECSAIERRKVTRPSKAELSILLWSKPTITIANELGVSDKAVYKWAKRYGLEKPPRGYWAKKRKEERNAELSG